MTDDPRSQRERMLAGDLYIADDPELARESARAAELYAARTTRRRRTTATLRRRILAELLGAFGEGSEIRPPFYCDYGYQTHIGARTFANFGARRARRRAHHDRRRRADRAARAAAHPDPPGRAELRRAKWEAAEPIAIGDNVWLGGGVIVCPASRSARTPSSALARNRRTRVRADRRLRRDVLGLSA